MSTWTKDKPTPGEWWLSLAPEHRIPSRPAVRRACITSDGDMLLRDTGGLSYVCWPERVFVGAQWMPANDPADPFAEQPRGNSRDDDLP